MLFWLVRASGATCGRRPCQICESRRDISSSSRLRVDNADFQPLHALDHGGDRGGVIAAARQFPDTVQYLVDHVADLLVAAG